MDPNATATSFQELGIDAPKVENWVYTRIQQSTYPGAVNVTAHSGKCFAMRTVISLLKRGCHVVAHTRRPASRPGSPLSVSSTPLLRLTMLYISGVRLQLYKKEILFIHHPSCQNHDPI